MKARTSWAQKRDKEQERAVKATPKGKMLIPAPRDVDAMMRKVPEGRLTTTDAIREKLARESGAELTCPLCTGIFSWIASEAAEEDRASGRKDITPYWRTLKGDGSLNPKFPGGVEGQAAKLRAEGHKVVPGRGKKPPRVDGFDKVMARL